MNGGYHYIQIAPGRWSVGTGDRDAGTWMPESNHATPAAAAERVHYLNGGHEGYAGLIDALRAMQRCPGIHATDQATGRTFYDITQTALIAAGAA